MAGNRAGQRWLRRWATLVWGSLLALLLAGCGSHLGSIGAMLVQNRTSGRMWVRNVPAQLTGAQAGLLAGDEILTIEGRDVRDLSPAQVHALLTGEVGTNVALTVLRSQEIKRLNVVRGPFQKSSAIL